MGVEIEKKFLVRDDSWRQQAVRSIPMHQGYLASEERCAVRVRIAGDKAFLTIKGKRVDGAAPEFEYPVPFADAEGLLTLASGPLVAKTRHLVPHGGKTWEVDEFSGDNAGLVMAEIELARADEPFDLPSWAGREVTGEKRFYNAHLVRYPFNSWPDDEKS